MASWPVHPMALLDTDPSGPSDIQVVQLNACLPTIVTMRLITNASMWPIVLTSECVSYP